MGCFSFLFGGLFIHIGFRALDDLLGVLQWKCCTFQLGYFAHLVGGINLSSGTHYLIHVGIFPVLFSHFGVSFVFFFYIFSQCLLSKKWMTLCG